MKKIRLSKQQKLEAYTYALFMLMFQNDEGYLLFVCNNFRTWHNKTIGSPWLSAWEDVSLYFPEFAAQMPLHVTEPTDQWWGHYDYVSRLKALRTAIQLTEQLPD